MHLREHEQYKGPAMKVWELTRDFLFGQPGQITQSEARTLMRLCDIDRDGYITLKVALFSVMTCTSKQTFELNQSTSEIGQVWAIRTFLRLSPLGSATHLEIMATRRWRLFLSDGQALVAKACSTFPGVHLDFQQWFDCSRCMFFLSNAYCIPRPRRCTLESNSWHKAVWSSLAITPLQRYSGWVRMTGSGILR